MSTLVQQLRDMGYEDAEIANELRQARKLLREYLDEGDLDAAENVCQEMWGLEPDFIIYLV